MSGDIADAIKIRNISVGNHLLFIQYLLASMHDSDAMKQDNSLDKHKSRASVFHYFLSHQVNRLARSSRESLSQDLSIFSLQDEFLAPFL